MTYPRWICAACGDRYGNGPCGIACWHKGTCHLCGAVTSVSEPRDFGHLRETPLLFRCTIPGGRSFVITGLENNKRALRALEFLDRHLTAQGNGPILSISVRGLTFHRTPEGAYLRSEND